jgi:hypothetical protein
LSSIPEGGELTEGKLKVEKFADGFLDKKVKQMEKSEVEYPELVEFLEILDGQLDAQLFFSTHGGALYNGLFTMIVADKEFGLDTKAEILTEEQVLEALGGGKESEGGVEMEIDTDKQVEEGKLIRICNLRLGNLLHKIITYTKD